MIESREFSKRRAQGSIDQICGVGCAEIQFDQEHESMNPCSTATPLQQVGDVNVQGKVQNESLLCVWELVRVIVSCFRKTGVSPQKYPKRAELITPRRDF